ncbi:uncharacterized protein VTP21DRAFT_9890 [Calcarisporiella thermophila]|uniref:uncharacterized protein n=1 Tax=Calcarisporiella thermophila TaxID=911321 RepID=UPI003744ABA9
MTDSNVISIRHLCNSNENECRQALDLLHEYAESLGFSLCFQNFDAELADFKVRYHPSAGGCFLVAYAGPKNESPVGIVGLRRLSPTVAEMKRLYVKPECRGKGLGRLLCERVLDEAVGMGYREVKLDTIKSMMGVALGMYQGWGFTECEAYCENPIEGASWYSLDLEKYKEIRNSRVPNN